VDVSGDADLRASRLAAAIGEPPRARILYCLVDGRARTSTELAVVAGVAPSTASVHLKLLTKHGLVKVFPQGKHRYYSLAGTEVAAALEALSVLAGSPGVPSVPNTPHRLRMARSCYDHMAGALGVALHTCFMAKGWFEEVSPTGSAYELTSDGSRAVASLGIDLDAARGSRRRFAFACVDWSERRPHLGGALGAAVLQLALDRRWVVRELDSRALVLTTVGRREMFKQFGLDSAHL